MPLAKKGSVYPPLSTPNTSQPKCSNNSMQHHKQQQRQKRRKSRHTYRHRLLFLPLSGHATGKGRNAPAPATRISIYPISSSTSRTAPGEKQRHGSWGLRGSKQKTDRYSLAHTWVSTNVESAIHRVTHGKPRRRHARCNQTSGQNIWTLFFGFACAFLFPKTNRYAIRYLTRKLAQRRSRRRFGGGRAFARTRRAGGGGQ